MIWLRALLFTILFPGTVAVAIPWWILRHWGGNGPGSEIVEWVGVLLIVVAGVLLLRCIADFASKGRGTLAPVDPPKHLVVAGPYRWTRNPMYVAVLGILMGEAAIYASPALAVYTLLVFSLFELFVVLYEEPALRRQFGDEYDRYRRRVPRWVGFVSKADQADPSGRE